MTLESIEEIVALMAEFPVAEIEVEEQGRRILVRKSVAPPVQEPSRAPELGAPAEPNTSDVLETPPAAVPSILLTAPMVGIFHHCSPPVGYGALVQPGQLVGYIEALKLMNEVTAETGGRVTEILEDNTAVGYGQPLFRVEPA